MNRTRFLLIVIVTLRSSLLNAEQDVIPSCGDCAVFSLVRLCGKPAKLTEVVANCEHDETRGMSIAGVRQGIEKFGIQTVAVKYSPTQLDQVPLPCVLYFRPGRWDPRNTQAGHFLTVASRDDKTVKAFNWSMVNPEVNLPRKAVINNWDGEAIVMADQLQRNWFLTYAAPLLGGIGVWWLLGGIKRAQGLSATTVLVMLVLHSGCSAKPAVPTGPPTLVLASTFFDAGDIAPDKVIETKISFTVNGQSSVKLTGLSKSCGCTTVDTDLINRELAPNSKHDLNVRINPGGTPASPELRTIQLFTDPPSPVTLAFAVQYRVKGPPVFPKVVRTETGWNQPATAEFTTTFQRATGESACWLSPSGSEFPSFEIVDVAQNTQETEKYADGTEFVVDICKVKLRSTKVFCTSETLEFKLAFPEQTPQTMVVDVVVAHPFLPLQTHSFVGQIKPGAEWTAALRWKKRIASLEFGRIDCPAGIRAEIGDSKVNIHGVAPRTLGRFKETIVVHFPGEKYPPVSLSVSGIVQ